MDNLPAMGLLRVHSTSFPSILKSDSDVRGYLYQSLIKCVIRRIFVHHINLPVQLSMR